MFLTPRLFFMVLFFLWGGGECPHSVQQARCFKAQPPKKGNVGKTNQNHYLKGNLWVETQGYKGGTTILYSMNVSSYFLTSFPALLNQFVYVQRFAKSFFFFCQKSQVKKTTEVLTKQRC